MAWSTEAATPGRPASNHAVLKWHVNAPVNPLTSHPCTASDAPRKSDSTKTHNPNPAAIARMANTAPRRGNQRCSRIIAGHATNENTGIRKASDIVQEPTKTDYHFSRLISSTLTVPRFRYIRRMMAKARPTSAAATVITNMAIICPSKASNLPIPLRYEAAAIRLIFNSVQHQLDGQHNQYRAPPRQHAVQTDPEESGAQQLVIQQRNHRAAMDH